MKEPVRDKIINLLTTSKSSCLAFNQVISMLPEYEPSFVVEVIQTLKQEGVLSVLYFIDHDFNNPKNLYPGRSCCLEVRTKGALCIITDEATGEEEFITDLSDLSKEIDHTLYPLR